MKLHVPKEFEEAAQRLLGPINAQRLQLGLGEPSDLSEILRMALRRGLEAIAGDVRRLPTQHPESSP